jgi:hypothetical protein
MNGTEVNSQTDDDGDAASVTIPPQMQAPIVSDNQKASAPDIAPLQTVDNQFVSHPQIPMPFVGGDLYTQAVDQPDEGLRFDFTIAPSTGGTHAVPPRQSPGNSLSHISPESSSQAQAYGTLLIGRGGRSKYLGPTAASDWLRDVSKTLPLR